LLKGPYYLLTIEFNRTRNVLERNNEALYCNRWCSGIAVSSKKPVCVFVALGIQHEMRMRYIVICGLSRSTIFFNIIPLTLNLPTTTIVAQPFNIIKWQLKFNPVA